MEEVTEAVRKARYNEAVIVNVASEEDGTSTREIILGAKIDEQNGGVVWNDISQSASEDDVGIVRHLRTKRWVLPMLNDKRRNELYNQAIRAASREAVARFMRRMSSSPQTEQEKCIHALDIGTGTGLLAMMASKHMQAALEESSHPAVNRSTNPLPTVQVTSIEMASAMARLAKLTIASNDMEESICVREEHSCEANLDHRSTLCTSELLDSTLLGEGILPALRDAWQRHLHPEAVIVPQRARIYAQLVESRELVGNYRGPYSSNSSVRLSMSSNPQDVMLGGDGPPEGQGIVVPLHAESLFNSDPSARVLTEPINVLGLSFTKDSIPGPEGGSRITRLEPNASGVAHGVLFWWELDLWEGLTYSTQQGKEPWQDHWQQCLYVFPEPHEACTRVVSGEPLDIRCAFNDNGLSFALKRPLEQESCPKRQRTADTDPLVPVNRHISPERALQLNDESRLMLLRQAIQTALLTKGNSSHFLDISDFSLCAMLAALEGAKLVTSLESSSGDIPIVSAKVAQIANGLPLKQNGAEFQILQCHAENLTNDFLFGKPAEIVAAEPYYDLLEGWPLQQALNYHYLISSLKERGLVKDTALSIPSYAAVMVCGIQCESLAMAYRGYGDESEDALVCGFRHATVNKYGDRYHQQDISLRACEYQHTLLIDSVQVANISFEKARSIEGNKTWTRLPLRRTGTLHGILCWVDYGLRVGGERGESDFRLFIHKHTFPPTIISNVVFTSSCYR